MTKTSLTRALFAAGVVAMAGAANAGGAGHLSSSDLSTPMAESSSTTMDSGSDTRVLGAGAATTSSAPSTTTVVTREYVYVQPSIDWDRSVVIGQMHNPHLVRGSRTAAAATFDVPARAGEASTMTGGAPNAVTSNDRVIVGSYVIPHATMTTSPYYVFSY